MRTNRRGFFGLVAGAVAVVAAKPALLNESSARVVSSGGIVRIGPAAHAFAAGDVVYWGTDSPIGYAAEPIAKGEFGSVMFYGYGGR